MINPYYPCPTGKHLYNIGSKLPVRAVLYMLVFFARVGKLVTSYHLKDKHADKEA
jgi:hypothetical protein